MSTIEQIQQQAAYALSGEAWHGPALLEILAGIDHHQALERKIPGKYNIWELVLHIIVWTRLATKALEGQPRPLSLTQEEDWPSVEEESAEAWERTLEEVKEIHQRFIQKVRTLDESDLKKTVPERDYDFGFLCFGAIHHTLYHAGQVALLKSLPSATSAITSG